MYSKSNIHENLLLSKGFHICKNCLKYSSIGRSYILDDKIGKGHYWAYNHDNIFNIVIHDFYFHDDFHFISNLEEFFSVSYFESVSGEELHPYHKISAGCIKSFWSQSKSYQAIYHKKIPIKSIGIEFMPKFCDEVLKEKYPNDYINPRSALISINETKQFPEMIVLLKQIEAYKGNGIAEKLFYESKAYEAISLIYDRHIKSNAEVLIKISNIDIKQLQNVTTYINDHYSSDLSLNKLCAIACMGKTKLKQTFKIHYKCTITQYIQQRRMSQAEHLLSETDLTSHQIALLVGYKSPSRFSQLFKKITGLSPINYRNYAQY